ncbi:LysR substrate-binding domain-containing protein [Cronobacter sakazakii]|nr:LysR substrate-binding domain-containing protein [Cronobacter sakazakii]MDQ9204122.1 LysR substrate-binding domain-containing protein [Cronobacter sakazakii]
MTLRNLDDLAVFVHVVECRSFSAAARALHLAPKTVSKQIARLEQALGATLFERNTRNLRITHEGRAIAERAKVALGVLEEMQEVATGASRDLRGIIRLTAPMPFGRKYVAPAIQDFCRLHPGVTFDLRLSDQMQDLYSDDLDLAIRMGELADSRLVALRVADNRRILAASPDYLKAHGQPAHPQDLAQHNCLVFAIRACSKASGRCAKAAWKKLSRWAARCAATAATCFTPGALPGWASRCERPGIYMKNCVTGG